MHEIRANFNLKPSIAPAAPVTATTKGTGVDLSLNGVDEEASVIINLGAYTDGTHTISVQESDDDVDGDYANVDVSQLGADSGVLNATTGVLLVNSSGGAQKVQCVTYIGSKRWLRVVDTVTGSPSTGLALSAVIVFGKRYAGANPGASNAPFN